MCFTSGTTGRSKGAILTHRNIEAMASGAIAFDRLTTNDRAIVTVPVAYNGGGVSVPLPLLKAGGSLLIRKEFDPARMLSDIARHAVTTIGMVPVIGERMAQEPGFDAADLSTWRVARCGGTIVPEPLLATYQARGVQLSSAYGLTEAGGYNLLLPPQDAIRKRGSIGQPVLGQRAKVVDIDGTEVDPGVPGELVLRGECVFAGYWRNEAASREVLRKGWLHTGDIAVMDDEGWFTVVDRKKDLIIAGGFNIYPTEVEQAIRTLDGVEDCCVVGLPDRYRGETVKAYVVAPSGTVTEDDVRAHCAAKLTAYKVPKLVELRAELPRNAVGKALRRQLVAAELAARDENP
jgi:fatty-acyl-CoA synthase